MRKDWWDKTQMVGNLLIALIIACVGWHINKTLQRNELDAKNFATAVDVLRTAPDLNKKNTAIREWAVKVFEKHNTVTLSKKAHDELLESALPSTAFVENPDGTKGRNPDGSSMLNPDGKPTFF